MWSKVLPNIVPALWTFFFIYERENWMNYYAVSWTHCYNKSCQMCPNGIITSSIMTAVCFTLSAPLSVSPLETGHVGSYQWGESLPQRHGLHPSGETAQPACGESTRTRENLHVARMQQCTHALSLPGRHTQRHKNDPYPSTKAPLRGCLHHQPAQMQPQRVKPPPADVSPVAFGAALNVCAALVHAPERSHMQTKQCWNVISHSPGPISIVRRRKECPQKTQRGFSVADGKNRKGTKRDLRNRPTSPRGVCLHRWSKCFKVMVEGVRERAGYV